MATHVVGKARLMLLAAMLLLVSVFSMAFAPNQAEAATTSQLRVAHLAPTVGNVDVYLNNSLTLSSVPYGAVTDFLTVAPGGYNVKVYGAGANPATSAPAVNENISLASGKAYTFAVLTVNGAPKGRFFEDDRSAPKVTRAKIKLLHASPDAGAIDIANQGGAVLFSNLTLGQVTIAREVPVGSYNLEIRRAGTNTVLVTLPTVTLAAGTVYTGVAQGLVGGTPAFATRLLTDATYARVRVAHLSPDTPPVDVFINGGKVLANVPFTAISNYLNLATGTYNIKIFASVANGQGTPAIEANVTVATGKDYTIAALGKLANITAGVYLDDNTRPAAGKARLRVIHASPDAPAVDIAVANGGPVLVPNLSFKDASGYLELPAGSYNLEVRVAGTSTVAYTIPTLNLKGGAVYSAIAEGLLTATPGFRVAAQLDEAFVGIPVP